MVLHVGGQRGEDAPSWGKYIRLIEKPTGCFCDKSQTPQFRKSSWAGTYRRARLEIQSGKARRQLAPK